VSPTQSGWPALAGPSKALAIEVLRHGPLARSELARRLRLSAASLTRLTRPLIDAGLFEETPVDYDRRTRRPTRPLDVVPESHHFVGVKLTGDTAYGVATTMRAGVVAARRLPLSAYDPTAVVAVVSELVATLAEEVPSVAALGVSVGGQTDEERVLVAPYFHWSHDVLLGKLLNEATGLPVVVDNDLLALTRAEHWFGAARDVDRFAVVTVGTGVGYSLVVHDEIVDDPDAGIGLVGHYPLDPFGPLCELGHRGCATGMLTIGSIRAAVAAGLRRSVGYDECLDLALAGDPVAARVVDDSARALGRLVAAVTNLTMARKIIVTGDGVRLAVVAEAAVHEGIALDRDPRTAPVRFEVREWDFTEWARGAAVSAIQSYVRG
jgi:predicted NBD/HSP70 family sugar kinase